MRGDGKGKGGDRTGVGQGKAPFRHSGQGCDVVFFFTSSTVATFTVNMLDVSTRTSHCGVREPPPHRRYRDPYASASR